MKYRIFSVLMILAMVASLCVVAAAPVSAQGDVTTVNATLGEDKAGKNTSCTIDLTGTWGVGDPITIEFPTAFDLSDLDMAVDDNDDYKNFKWNGAKIDSDALLVSGKKITIYAPSASPATFVISANGGLINPNTSQEAGVDLITPTCNDGAPDSPYVIKANSTAAPAVEIFDWLEVSKTKFASGDSVTVTAHGFQPGMTVTLGGALQGSGVVESDGTAEIDANATGTIAQLTAEDGSGRRACLAAGTFTLLPVVTVTPTQGSVCTEIIITGKDFAIAPIEINIGGNVLAIAMPILQDLDNDGAVDDFKLPGVTVPRKLNGGTYDVNVVANVTAKGSFTVQEKVVTVSPASGAPGTMVTIDGSGFCDNDKENGIDGVAVLMYGNTPQGGAITTADIEVDDQGNFTAVGEIPEDASEGLHGVLVCFSNCRVEGVNNDCPCQLAFHPLNPAVPCTCISAQGMFAVTDRVLTVVPSKGPLGTSITVSGGNFGSDAGGVTPRLEVNYFEDPGLPTLEPLSTAGQMVPETFKVDDDEGFRYGDDNIIRVIATCGGSDLTAACTFDVTRPTLQLDKTRGPRGTLVKVTGSGWQTSGLNFVTIAYQGNGPIDNATVAVVEPNGNGDIAAQFKIPAFSDNDMGGNETNLIFTANDGQNNSLQSIFTVTVPRISVDPESASAGEEITVKGVGFLPQSQVQEISLANAPIVPIYELKLTDAQGSFEITGKVPGVMPGGYAINARVNQNEGAEITCPFTVVGGAASAVTVEEGFASIGKDAEGGEYLFTKVWTFDSKTKEWLVYDIASGAPDQFDTLLTGQGYWVEVTEDCTLTYSAYTYDLIKGWNLIGWQG